MGLFGKKAKTVPCPICGKEMNPGLFGDSKAVADGTICGDCERMLRGKFDLVSYDVRRADGSIRRVSEDTLSELTLEEIRGFIKAAEAKQAEVQAAFGEEFSSALTVEHSFSIAPKAIDVGLKRAKELKNKVVVQGPVQLGELSRGDEAVLVRGSDRKPVTLLDVIPCEGSSDFDTELKANIRKKTAAAGRNAWLILDLEGEVRSGDVIAKV